VLLPESQKSQKYTFCHGLRKSLRGRRGYGALLWGSGPYQESQYRAAPRQFAYGWHSHHAGHQQPDGLDEAFSTMRNFWQWQLVDQAPQQHWHLHAGHALAPGLVWITHADTEQTNICVQQLYIYQYVTHSCYFVLMYSLIAF